MKQRFMRFMYGRSGADELFRFTSYASIVLLLIAMFLPANIKSIVLIVVLALMVYTYFRAFSKNLKARREENAKFLRLKAKLRNKYNLRRDIWKQRKDFKFFTCPSCKAVLRVPRGKGKIRVVCKKCGNAFERKT